jgi:NarL family two-component system response regulator LiaR
LRMEFQKNRLIRVMIVDDHPMVRKGLSSFIMTNKDLQLVGEASNGKEAITICSEKIPDVILIDLIMPVMDGFSAIKNILRLHPETKIIALTSYHDPQLVNRAVKAGVKGFLLKDVSSDELHNAICSVYEGRTALSQSTRELMTQITEETQDIESLTDRENEVFHLLLEGMTNPEIADKLHISRATVKVHVSHIYEKLPVCNRIELMKKYASLLGR